VLDVADEPLHFNPDLPTVQWFVRWWDQQLGMQPNIRAVCHVILASHLFMSS
jgi:hypothetical protein